MAYQEASPVRKPCRPAARFNASSCNPSYTPLYRAKEHPRHTLADSADNFIIDRICPSGQLIHGDFPAEYGYGIPFQRIRNSAHIQHALIHADSADHRHATPPLSSISALPDKARGYPSAYPTGTVASRIACGVTKVRP